MPACGPRIDFATGVDQRWAQFVEDQRAPVKADQASIVEMDQQAARGGAEQRIGSATTGITRSAREDLVVEFGAKLSQRTPASGLFATMPSLDGRLENAPLIAHLLMQWDVAGFDTGHDVEPRHADEIGRLLRAENGVRRPLGCSAAIAACASKCLTAQQSGEVILAMSTSSAFLFPGR